MQIVCDCGHVVINVAVPQGETVGIHVKKGPRTGRREVFPPGATKKTMLRIDCVACRRRLLQVDR